MHKIWIIIQREYTSRVKNKRFLMVTFLVPLLMVGLIVGSAYFSFKGTEERKIAVVDPNGFFKDKLKNSKQLKFEFPKDVDTSNYQAKGYSDILLMPLFEEDKKFIQNYLFARFSALSADEFFKLAKMILRGDAKATSILDRMVKEIVAHLNEVHSDDDEDYDTDEDGDTMGPDDDDLSDLDDFLGSLGIRRPEDDDED